MNAAVVAKDGGDEVTNLDGGAAVGAGQLAYGLGLSMQLHSWDFIGRYEGLGVWSDSGSCRRGGRLWALREARRVLWNMRRERMWRAGAIGGEARRGR